METFNTEEHINHFLDPRLRVGRMADALAAVVRKADSKEVSNREAKISEMGQISSDVLNRLVRDWLMDIDDEKIDKAREFFEKLKNISTHSLMRVMNESDLCCPFLLVGKLFEEHVAPPKHPKDDEVVEIEDGGDTDMEESDQGKGS